MAAATKDAVLISAVDLARAAAVDLAERPSDVGEHLGYVVEGERLVSHRFTCLARGYRGWVWTVTVARVPRGRVATLCEAVLLPGDDAILAPEWLPWNERLRPGDIGPGDVVPFRSDDPRLEPGWTPTGDEELDSVAIEELALARERVLSPEGLDAAAQRWYAGSQGPTSAGSLAASAACLSCGFFIPLQGSLGTVFGVCANEWSPDDGRVVSFDHGCGAHSETDTEPHASDWPDSNAAIDDLDVELVSLRSTAAEAVDAEPADTEPADDEPVDNESADAAPADAEPVDAEPADNEPADNEPAVPEVVVSETTVSETTVSEAEAEVPEPMAPEATSDVAAAEVTDAETAEIADAESTTDAPTSDADAPAGPSQE